MKVPLNKKVESKEHVFLHCVKPGCDVILVKAPPGFGKTKWALLTAHLGGFVLFTEDSEAHIGLLKGLLGIAQHFGGAVVFAESELERFRGWSVVLDGPDVSQSAELLRKYSCRVLFATETI